MKRRGFALVIVLVVLVVLAGAGAWALDAVQADIRASGKGRRQQLITQAAEAGAAARIAEIGMAADDAGAALQSRVLASRWPRPGTFGADEELDDSIEYGVESQMLTAQDGRPPPGVQVDRGGQTVIFEVRSTSVYNGLEAGERGVSVGVKLYARAGLSYNN